MGEVWEARDEGLRRPVAVKVISVLAGGGSRADEARARFLREARITAALQHPNIVTVHDLGEAATDEGTTPFLVMELLRGQGLDAVVRRGPVGGADAVRWGAQVCDALAEAHAAGILHRDIKPANVFLTATGHVKVLDFGIARAADPSATGDRLTHTGFVVGTAAYMAPEQARGHPEQRSDLYALGCVLFELLTGRPPFTAPDTIGYLTAHLHDPPPAPSGVVPGVPAAWDRLVLRLLAKDPSLRHDSATALADELRHLGGPAPAAPAARRYTPTVAAPASDDLSRAPTADAPAGPARRAGLGRRQLLLGGAGVAALAVAGGSAALYLTGDPGKGPVAWSRTIGDVDLLNTNGPDIVLADGRCHVAAGAGSAVLHAVDLASGEPLWQAALDAPWAGGTRLAVADGIVLAAARNPDGVSDMLYGFDAAGGERLWRRPIEDGTTGLDVYRPGGPLITSEERHVLGIDPRTGSSLWGIDVSPYDGFVPAGDLVLLPEGRAVLGETGEERWVRSDLFPKADRAHVLDEGFLCFEAGETAAVDLVLREAGAGDVLWRSPFRQDEPEPSAGALPPVESLVSGSTVFMPLPAGDRDRPTALDARTGERKWTFGGAYPPDGQDGPVTSVPGGFLLPTRDGTVCLAADDGTERWRDDAKNTQMVRTTGAYALLYRTADERLFQRWTTLRILGAENGRRVWTGQFDSDSVSDAAAGDDLIVVLDNGGTLWALPG
ncbi:protein kinase domain-containing protein [Streptomyces specialis]|uniref:serine/threonine-protein kinase n=1 Tax=Streptomyces specialis TaxID=498367 RepID=UPI000AA18D19|nr:serine/threonine-protein kinase [Streptomyces specialis]